jgi:predicted nuclease with RNAse H fold
MGRMKKSELKEVIKDVLRRRLNEIGESPAKQQYGIVVGDENGEPKIQVVGYGVMKLSTLKSEAVKAIDAIRKESQAGNFKNVEHLLSDKGILMLFVRALREVTESLKSKGVNEIAPTSSQTPGDAVADALNASSQQNPADQKKTMDLEKQKNDLQTKLEITKARMSKTLTPFQRQIKQSEEKLGRVNVELQRLQTKTGK